MKALPDMKYSGSIQSSTQRAFGGLNHRSSAADGEIYDMENMTSDEYPLVTPRAPRYVIEKIDKPNGIYSLDGLLLVAGETVYYKNKEIGTVSDGKKTICALGSKIVILPDKVYYDTADGNFAEIEKTWKGQPVFQGGSYGGQTAVANTIYQKDTNWSDFFKVGDAVAISGATKHPENNKTVIVREIDGSSLRFYENTFTITNGLTKYSEETEITISRTMPDLDFICENDNRLWGCKGDTVYASKLGDLTNWNVFDGIASDSYAVDVGTPGDFTGCFTYLGYPCFFKDDVIYKVYGDKPSNFQLIRSASLGVSEGNEKSLAVAGEILFYMSRTGIVAYSGSTPQDVFLPFGDEKYNNCVAGSDGKKYYVSMQKRNSEYILAVFDTSFNTWHIEDDVNAVGFAWYNGLYILSDDGTLRLVGNAPEVPDGAEKEKSVSSSVTFAPFTYGTSRKKGVSKIGISCELEKNAEIRVEIEYDSSGEWQTVSKLDTPERRSFYLPVIPHRCDHYRLKLSGKGKWRLFSLTKEYYYGSMN